MGHAFNKMKIGLKISIISAIVIVAGFGIVLALHQIQEMQRREAMDKWREVREDWLDGKQSEIESFSGINCSALGFADIDCFFDAYRSCSPAIIDQTRNTIEGDPISVTARITPECTIDLIHDSTMDRYSHREVRGFVCDSVIMHENMLAISPCSDGITDEEYGFSIYAGITP